MVSESASIARHPSEPKWSEANTQAEFYHQARLAGLPIVLEVLTPAGRIDVAVLRPDRSGIVAVVEVKHDGRTLSKHTRQIQRYKRLGVPVYGLVEFANAARLVATIVRRDLHSPGVSWADVQNVVPIPRRFTPYRRATALAPAG